MTNRRDPISVAIVGTAHWYYAFDLAEWVRTCDRARLAVVADADEKRARQVAAVVPGTPATTGVEAVLERGDVDVVAVLGSSDVNPAICAAAAAAGKHIVSMNPVALDLASAESIATAVGSAGVLFFPLESSWRVTPEAASIADAVRSGEIGTPLLYSHRLIAGTGEEWPGGRPGGFWTEAHRVPGGAWINHGIFAVDQARWLLGRTPTSVTGSVARLRYRERQLEDHGIAAFSFDGEVVAIIEDSWIATSETVEFRALLHGSEGSLALPVPWGPAGAGAEHLIDCLDGARALVATANDAVENLRICLAFYEAARIGTRVVLAG